MRVRLGILAAVFSLCVGCQSTYQGSGAPAELCNTPGRKALADQIVARGGLLVTEENHWDNSVEPATKQQMGPPLSNVVLPQDKFSSQDVAHAQAIFPEAQVSNPTTLDEFYESSRAEPATDD
ncbi:MAG TPA: hypothetical protein VHY91_04895 [Pirellulales bacterium]|jgi:hypothetical protein|nr:hypothetical protein [Pirellulales bacterium]